MVFAVVSTTGCDGARKSRSWIRWPAKRPGVQGAKLSLCAQRQIAAEAINKGPLPFPRQQAVIFADWREQLNAASLSRPMLWASWRR